MTNPPNDTKTKAAVGGAESEGPLFEGPGRWVEAEQEVRLTLKWLLSGLGAAATVLFGSGALLTGFSYETTWSPLSRSILALALVGAGIACVVFVAGKVLAALQPVELAVASLNRTGNEWKARVEACPTLWLPKGVENLDEFQEELRELAARSKQRRIKVAQWQAIVNDGGNDNVDLHEAKWRLGNLKELSEVTDVNLATFQRARDLLLAQASHAEATKRANLGGGVGLAVVVVVVCAAAYVMVVAGTEPDDPPAASPAILTGVDEGFLTATGLSGCASIMDLGGTDGAVEGIPVLMSERSGSTVQFEVIPIDGCPAIEATLPLSNVTFVSALPSTYELGTTTATDDGS